MEQIVAAAHELFAQSGYAEVTMDGVAAKVGVTKPLLYNYFGNKERLYLACVERSGEALFETIGEAVKASSSPGDTLRNGLLAFFAFLDEDRAAWAVIFDESLPQQGEIADTVTAYRGRIVEFVSVSLVEQIPPERRAAARTEVEALSAALLGAAEALARWWLRTETLSARAAAELLIATLEPGLRERSALISNPPNPNPKGDRS